MKLRSILVLVLFTSLLSVSTSRTASGSEACAASPPGQPPSSQPQSPANGEQITTFGPTLLWTNSPGARQVQLQVCPAMDDGPAVDLLLGSPVTQFQLPPPPEWYGLLPGMHYYWRVRNTTSNDAAPAESSWGEWSTYATFRMPEASSAGISPLQPANGGSVDILTPLLQWANIDSRVFYYEIQLSRDPGFNTNTGSAIAPVFWELVHGGVTSPLNSYQVRGEFSVDSETRYFWRVRPRIQGDGSPVAWSDTFSFTTPKASVGLEKVFPDLTFERLTNMVQPNYPTGRMFVTEQRGVVRVLFPDGRSEVFLDIQEKVLTANNEEGLLGLAFDPDVRNNGYFYLYYSADGPRRNVLSRFSVSVDNPNRADGDSETVLLDLPKPFGNHNGGQLAFGPDGYLYLGPGDGGGGGDPFRNAQNLESLLGKVLRVDVSGAPAEGYRIPPDNPFVGVPGARGEVWAYGMRNPWRFSFDRATGKMWAGDVGQNAWEEIDTIEKGRNYGWNIMEGSHCYSPPSGCDRAGLELPVTEYNHDDGCSVTGGYVYRGNGMPSFRGAYIYGDYCSGKVWGLWHDGSRVVQEKQLLDSGLQITSFAEDASGEIYVLSRDDGIYKLVEQ